MRPAMTRDLPLPAEAADRQEGRRGEISTDAARRPQRIILIRHGQPAIPINPRTGHKGFRAYIADYEEAGLDPASLPPAELHDLVGEVRAVFTSNKPRARQSARSLARGGEIIVDPLFMEAPLAAPRIPLLRMRVPKWAIIARVLWHTGFHPEIEPPAELSARARRAAEILIARAAKDGSVALVAHGYFNFLIGRVLRARGFAQTGTHRAKFWNAVVYVRGEGGFDGTRSRA